MRTFLSLLAAFLIITLLSGCASGLYSKQDFGPKSISGGNIEEVIQNNGPPDVVGGSDQYMTMTWYHTEGLQILNLFSTVSKKPMGVVINEKGKVISKGTGTTGEALTILGSKPMPVSITETK